MIEMSKVIVVGVEGYPLSVHACLRRYIVQAVFPVMVGPNLVHNVFEADILVLLAIHNAVTTASHV